MPQGHLLHDAVVPVRQGEQPGREVHPEDDLFRDWRLGIVEQSFLPRRPALDKVVRQLFDAKAAAKSCGRGQCVPGALRAAEVPAAPDVPGGEGGEGRWEGGGVLALAGQADVLDPGDRDRFRDSIFPVVVTAYMPECEASVTLDRGEDREKAGVKVSEVGSR